MDTKILLVIIGMTLVTYLPRMLPMTILSKVQMPQLFLRWLKYVPPAVLAALLMPSIFVANNRLVFGLNNKFLLAAIPCFLIGVKTRSLFLTVFCGIAVMCLLNILGGS